MDARERSAYIPPMAERFEVREHWRDVTVGELEAFLLAYPRSLEARPPLGRKANYREWCDPTLGKWPGNAVAKSWTRGGCHGCQIRVADEAVAIARPRSRGAPKDPD
jgi:hypothetical protein